MEDGLNTRLQKQACEPLKVLEQEGDMFKAAFWKVNGLEWEIFGEDPNQGVISVGGGFPTPLPSRGLASTKVEGFCAMQTWSGKKLGSALA